MPKPLLDDSAFSPVHCAWQPTAAREEIQPECTIDLEVSRNGAGGSLRVRCSQKDQYGGFVRTVEGITPEAWYRFDAYYRAEGMSGESE